MSWFTWLGRSAERDRAYGRLASIRQSYGDYGDKVIRLSARTDLARKSAGSTQRAFDFVEQSFAAATSAYAHVDELLGRLDEGLKKGKVGDFTGAETALRDVGTKLEELDRNLTAWESKWQEVPRTIAGAEQALTSLRQEAEAAQSAIGAALPIMTRMEAMAQYLVRANGALTAGNPLEAAHLVDDLQIAMGKVQAELELYTSGVGAIRQAEDEVSTTRTQVQAMAAPAEAPAALATAEALLPGLRPALAAGRLEQFQHDLLQLQAALAKVRSYQH